MVTQSKIQKRPVKLLQEQESGKSRRERMGVTTKKLGGRGAANERDPGAKKRKPLGTASPAMWTKKAKPRSI
jgi:hypothetical protein